MKKLKLKSEINFTISKNFFDRGENKLMCEWNFYQLVIFVKMRNLKKCCVKFIRFMQVIFLRMKKFVKKKMKKLKNVSWKKFMKWKNKKNTPAVSINSFFTFRSDFWTKANFVFVFSKLSLYITVKSWMICCLRHWC